MRNGKVIIIIMIVLIFLFGLAVFLYPYIHKAVVDTTLRNDAQEFIDRVTEVLWEDESPTDELAPEETDPPHKEL